MTRRASAPPSADAANRAANAPGAGPFADFLQLTRRLHGALARDPHGDPPELAALEQLAPTRGTNDYERAQEADSQRYLVAAGVALVADVAMRLVEQSGLLSPQGLDHPAVRARMGGDPRLAFRRYGALLTEATHQVAERTGAGLRSGPYPGYQRVLGLLDDVLPDHLAAQGAQPLTVEELLAHGFRTAAAVAPGFAEVVPEVLLRDGVLTDADLRPEARDRTLAKIQSATAASSFLRDTARIPADALKAHAMLMAKCTEGCTKQRADGQVPQGVAAPAHTLASMRQVGASYASFSDFLRSHPLDLPIAPDWFETHVSEGPAGPTVVSPALAGATAEYRAALDRWRSQQVPPVYSRGALGCPALFGGMIRRFGGGVASAATSPVLWGSQLDRLRLEGPGAATRLGRAAGAPEVVIPRGADPRRRLAEEGRGRATRASRGTRGPAAW